MTSEDVLKEYILSKYKSIRQFAIENNLKYSTVTAILSRGLKNSSLENTMEICKALRISTESLVVKSEIVPLEEPKFERRLHIRRLEVFVREMKRKARLPLYSIDNIVLTEEEVREFATGMELLIELCRKRRRDLEE